VGHDSPTAPFKFVLLTIIFLPPEALLGLPLRGPDILGSRSNVFAPKSLGSKNVFFFQLDKLCLWMERELTWILGPVELQKWFKNEYL
jgi:hypothetical protein